MGCREGGRRAGKDGGGWRVTREREKRHGRMRSVMGLAAFRCRECHKRQGEGGTYDFSFDNREVLLRCECSCLSEHVKYFDGDKKALRPFFLCCCCFKAVLWNLHLVNCENANEKKPTNIAQDMGR